MALTIWTYIIVNKVLNVKEQLCFVIDYHSKNVEIKKLPNMTADTVNTFVWCIVRFISNGLPINIKQKLVISCYFEKYKKSVLENSTSKH